MIKYWPTKQSIKLNNAVVDLFIETEHKLIYDLSNKTNYYLYTDILNNIGKNKLFYVILNEFKQLILELIEANLNERDLKKLNKNIMHIFTEKIYKNFLSSLNNKYQKEQKIYKKKLNYIENYYLIESLIIYLVLGSSAIDQNIFLFDRSYTPYKHVQILFENFLIQISNITICRLFNKRVIIYNVNNTLRYIYNKAYISNRSIALLINNLVWQNFLYSYIDEPQYIYNERNRIWLISSRGIINKYIYTNRIQEIKKFTKFRIFFLLLLEIKDILIPKIEKFLVLIGQYIIYLSINLLSNIIIIFIKIIIFYLRK
uniref:Uncharacterized protein n=1 Tax=Bostrychia moritziana TaxID=103713 RepID=A0A1Z1M6E4_BOSMO|nr:hypothetical protein [Bostrychia moritziana]ARW61576.1 hypothetical protein [Bostrychia moritziana]